MLDYSNHDTLLAEAKRHGLKIDACEIEDLRNGAYRSLIAPLVFPDDQDGPTEEEVLRPGFSAATDLVLFEGPEGKEPNGLHIAEFVVACDRQVQLRFQNVSTGAYAASSWVFDAETGIQPQSADTVDRDLDVLIFRTYSERCGRWRGRRRRWRVCTGKDCSDGIVCIVWQRTWL